MNDRDSTRAFYDDDELRDVLRQLVRAGWPEYGSYRCPRCKRATGFKPGYTTEHEYLDIICDHCGTRPRVEIERHVGATNEDDE